MHLHLFFIFATALLLAAAGSAHAGASLFVDDAAIAPSGRCQLESWVRVHSSDQELTAVPACNIAGTEFGIGVSDYFSPRVGPHVALGAKRLFRDFDSHDWGLGISAGAVWKADRDRFDSWNLNLPASFALDGARHAVVHANLGWNEPRDGPGALTAGVGTEFVLAEEWLLLGEAYGDHRGGFGAQLGLRRTFGERINFDLLAGKQRDQASWLALGVNLLF